MLPKEGDEYWIDIFIRPTNIIIIFDSQNFVPEIAVVTTIKGSWFIFGAFCPYFSMILIQKNITYIYL